MPLGMEVGLGPGDFVLDETQLSLPKKGSGAPPIFGACLLWPNGWIDQDGTCMEVGLCPGYIVLDGDPAPPPPKVRSPQQFSAHIGCGQMATWIKIPLGRELGLDPSDIVLDGYPAPPSQKGAQPPIFSPCLLCPNGWMDQDATWYGGRPRPKRHCVRWGPSSPSSNWGRTAQFSVHVYCAQTARWIKMPLGVEVGLDPSDIVLDGDPAPPPQKGAEPP